MRLTIDMLIMSAFRYGKNRRVTSTWQEPQYAYAEDIIEHNKKLLQPPIS